MIRDGLGFKAMAAHRAQQSSRSESNRGSGGTTITAVVFDVGGVLLDWNPRYLYRKLLPDEESVERFLTEVCTPEWNLAQDAGRTWAAAVAALTARFPDRAELIRAYDERWTEMVAGPIGASVAVLEELRARDVATYALTNFSTEKWDVTVERWPFLRGFTGAVVSGWEGVTKPGPEIYHRLLDRYGLDPRASFYTDDAPHNVDGARRVGIRAEPFTGGDRLRAQLADLGVLAMDPA